MSIVYFYKTNQLIRINVAIKKIVSGNLTRSFPAERMNKGKEKENFIFKIPMINKCFLTDN